MSKVHVIMRSPPAPKRWSGAYVVAITKEVEMTRLPIGSTYAFRMPFSEGEDGAGENVIHMHGCLMGKIDDYMGQEDDGSGEKIHVFMTAKGDFETFQKMTTASWLAKFGWEISESVLPE